MIKPTAFTTALAVLAMLPANRAAAVDAAELILEEHYSRAGYDVELHVTRGDDGILGEATITDPASGDAVDVWTDGTTVWWDGTVAGEPMRGDMPTVELDPQAAPICFTPVTAILCLGAFVVLTSSGTCATLKGPCPVPEPEFPDGGRGVPPDDGGDGDGDGESGGSGGDED